MGFYSAARLVVTCASLATAACQASGSPSQLVKEDPATVYAAFADAFSDGAMGGATQHSDLWHGGMQTLVEKTSDKKLKVITKFDGQTATEVHFTFTSQDGGKATFVEADIDVDQEAMRNAFAGTPNEQLGDLPHFAHAAGMKRLMARYAERIVSGTALNDATDGWMTGDVPAEFFNGLPENARAQIRQQEEEARQQAATSPMVDANVAAQRFLNGGASR